MAGVLGFVDYIIIHFFVTSELLPLLYVPISLLGPQTGPKSTKVRFNALVDSLSFGGGRAIEGTLTFSERK